QVMVLEGFADGLPRGLRTHAHHRGIEDLLLEPRVELQLLADGLVEGPARDGVGPRLRERAEERPHRVMIVLQQVGRIHRRLPENPNCTGSSLTESSLERYNCQYKSAS